MPQQSQQSHQQTLHQSWIPTTHPPRSTAQAGLAERGFAARSALAFTPVVAAERGGCLAGQRCSSTGVPAATPTPKPAIRPARQTWRSRDLTALHLVCRRFLIRINCLARLPVRPKLDSESLSCLLCLWFLFTFPAQSPLASGCFLSGRAFYILPPASVTSVQTCGWDTALLAFPSPVTPIQHSAAVFQRLRGPRLWW